MIEINNNPTQAELLMERNRHKESRSEELLRKRGSVSGVPEITNRMARSVSDERRELMELQLEAGEFREQGSGFSSPRSDERPIRMIQTQAGIVSHNGKGLYKMANGSSGVTSAGSGWRGSNDTVRQVPEVYSPLWLNSNLNLPRDRPTINAWSRSFFALNPIVHNAITLHSTYPIAKLNIKSKNPKVEKFFSQMIEEIDLMNVAVMAAQEYWILGEAFIYGELDESAGKWTRLMILNPDYVNVQRSVIAAEPIISLRPDENLRRVVHGNQAGDIQQRKQLDPSIIEHVRRNENIPLNNFYVHHMARRISPYEIRGTGLIVSCFRALMLFDKFRECYSKEHEVLTNQGFKKIHEITEISTTPAAEPNLSAGVELDSNGNVTGILKLKDGIQIACFNAETEEIEYHVPQKLHISHYAGKMLHFHGKKVDAVVTPEHKMWVKEKDSHGSGYSDWHKITAYQMTEKKTWWKLRSHAKWSGKKIESVEVCGKQIPADLYLKFLGYVVSEGCVYRNNKNGRYDEMVHLSQLTKSPFYTDMQDVSQKFAQLLDKNCTEKISIIGAGYSKDTPKEKWECRIHGKDLVQHFFDNIGDETSANSHNKSLPRWVMDLCPEQLQVLLDALVAGDGSTNVSKYGTDSKSMSYSTVSKQLADDVYEIVFKCGYAPNIHVSDSIKSDGRRVVEYRVLWSDTNYGNEPNIYTGNRTENGNGGGAIVDEVDYDDIVWCFTVPTGLFITRHNNKIAVLGNSSYAQSENMVNPLTLVKIGSSDFRPTPVDLENFRNVFECYDEDTEVLTNQGFKRFDEVVWYQKLMDGTCSVPYYESGSYAGIEIACFNPESEKIEYHQPTRSTVYDYDGDLVSFKARNMDVRVTPNHDMWVKANKSENWRKVKAEKLQAKTLYRTRAVASYEGKNTKYIDILGKTIPMELYLKFIGYLVSEGSIESRSYSYSNINEVCLTQNVNSDCIDDIRSVVNEFAQHLGISVYERTRVPSGDIYKTQPSDIVHFHLRSKTLVSFLTNEFSTEDFCNSKTKTIPQHILDLNPSLLTILLEALVAGDGSRLKNKNSNGFRYYTSSKVLADKVQEIAFKCGYSSNLIVRDRVKAHKGKRIGQLYNSVEYIVSWSDAKDGQYPSTFNNVSTVNYKGKVWCFTVPTGLFITRRNGKITIQGNSAQSDKDFKIFTHNDVTVERVGYNSGILDTSANITQLIKEIYIGLMVPSVIMDGSDTTYATGSVALDVLRQRYMQFRQMMTGWLKRKIFAPISQINDFYEYIDGEKTLIVPEVDWNHMSLFDMDSYITNMANLSQGDGVQKRVSLQTLYRSLGLEYEEEQRKIRFEDIQDAIRTREIAAMQKYSLHELKALGPGDEIDEAADEPVPGQSPYEPAAEGGAPGGAPGGLMGGGPPPSLMGGPKPGGAPPPAPIGGGGSKPPAPPP